MENRSAAALDATHGASEPVSKPPLTRTLVGALGALVVTEETVDALVLDALVVDALVVDELVTRVLDALAADELVFRMIVVVERGREAVFFSMAQSAES